MFWSTGSVEYFTYLKTYTLYITTSSIMSNSFADNELESIIRRASQYREHHPELTAAMEAFDPDAAREAALLPTVRSAVLPR